MAIFLFGTISRVISTKEGISARLGVPPQPLCQLGSDTRDEMGTRLLRRLAKLFWRGSMNARAVVFYGVCSLDEGTGSLVK